MKNTLFTRLALLATLTLTGGAVFAQDQPVQTDPGVARVSLIQGEVSTQRGDSGDYAAAVLNAPVVTGDKVTTGDNSRAEVQLDFANILRLSDRSQATIANLANKQIQVQVGEGAVSYSSFKNSESQTELDTPNVAVHPAQQDVSFRVVVVSQDETRVTVRQGEVEVSTPNGSTTVRRGEEITVRGAGTDAQYKVGEASGRDEWDRWNDDRDHLIHNAEGFRHTNPYYVGSQDLDAYGHWSNLPDYGSVWVPSVAADWVPYRAGRWVFEPYYGWTWVSSEPWGWAPYHYGRWLFSGASWVWWPGPVGGGYGGYGGGFYRPIWAPAYVSFFGFGGGFGGGFGVGFGFGGGFGSYGWLPLGPCDSFYPWYGGYRSRFNSVNVVNITNVYNSSNTRNLNLNRNPYGPLHSGNQYSNLRLAATNHHIQSGITTISAQHFGTGRGTPTGVDAQTFHNGHLMTGNLPVVPTRESLLPSSKAVSPSTIRGGSAQRFFGKSTAAVQPVPFEKQAAQVQQAIVRDGHFTPVQSGGQPVNTARVTTPANSGSNLGQGNVTGKPVAGSGSGSVTTPVKTAPATSTSNGAQNGTANTNNGRNSNPTPANNGWQRFGQNGTAQGSVRGQVPSQNPGQNAGRGTVAAPAAAPQSNPNRGVNTPRSGVSQPSTNPRPSAPDQGGWQRFSGTSSRPPAAPQRSNGNGSTYGGSAGGYRPAPAPVDRGGSAPRVYSTPQQPSRSYGGNSGGGYYSRPTLDLRQPVVTQRGPQPAPAQRAPAPVERGGGYSSRPYSGGGGGGSPSGGYRAPASQPSQPSHSSGGGNSAPANSGGGHHR